MEKAASKLVRILKRQRKSVSFFEWPGSEMKELAILEEFTASLAACGGPSLVAPRHAVKAPPEIIAQDQEGHSVGIEVTHLADQEVAREHEAEQALYRDWTAEEVINEIEKRIRETDRKPYHGGPYADLLLLIDTDEPKICYNDYAESLGSHVFTALQHFTKVYLLFSYDRTGAEYRCMLLKTGKPAVGEAL